MPAPLVQPRMRTSFPPTRHFAAAHFGRVSVVMIARVNCANALAEDFRARTSGRTAFTIFCHAQRHADDAGGADENLRWVEAAEFARNFQSRRGGRAQAFRACAAIGVAGIDDHSAHAVLGLSQIQLRSDYWCGLYAVGGEDGGSRGGRFTDKNRQIKLRLFQAAMRGGESKAARHDRIGKARWHGVFSRPEPEKFRRARGKQCVRE